MKMVIMSEITYRKKPILYILHEKCCEYRLVKKLMTKFEKQAVPVNVTAVR